MRLRDEPADAGLELGAEAALRIAGAAAFREHVHPVAGEQSVAQEVHAGLVDAAAAHDRRGFAGGEEPGLERRPEEVERVGAHPADALVGAADEVAGEERIVEQGDVVAEREEAASAARLHGVEVLAAFDVEAVHTRM